MNRDPDTVAVVDTTDWPPMTLQPGDILQTDCKRLEAFATEGEMPRLQAIYDASSYADLTLDQLVLMRDLQVREQEVGRGG